LTLVVVVLLLLLLLLAGRGAARCRPAVTQLTLVALAGSAMGRLGRPRRSRRGMLQLLLEAHHLPPRSRGWMRTGQQPRLQPPQPAYPAAVHSQAPLRPAAR
jgi:hypothetical protein